MHFKKLVVKGSVLVLLSINIAKAQLLVGPTVGPNISWITFEDKELRSDYQVKPVWGFHAGANISFRVQKRFFLHTSFIYSQKGFILEGNIDKSLKDEVKHSSLDMPLLYTAEFKHSAGNGRVFKWYLGAGPNVSYWLGGTGKLQSSELLELNIDELKYKVSFDKVENGKSNQLIVQNPNRAQLGLNVAAGLVFEPMPKQTFMLMLRYELGHSFLSKEGNGIYPAIAEYQQPLKVRNKGLRLSISYLIDTNVANRKKGKSTVNKKRLH